MKDVNLLIWLTQLGLTVAVPPAAFILLAVWLRSAYGVGNWVIWVAAILGLYCAITGLMSTLRALSRMTDKKEESKGISFNEHD